MKTITVTDEWVYWSATKTIVYPDGKHKVDDEVYLAFERDNNGASAIAIDETDNANAVD